MTIDEDAVLGTIGPTTDSSRGASRHARAQKPSLTAAQRIGGVVGAAAVAAIGATGIRHNWAT